MDQLADGWSWTYAGSTQPLWQSCEREDSLCHQPVLRESTPSQVLQLQTDANEQNETLRLYGVLELQLSGKYTGQEKDFLAGNGRGRYSFADVCSWGWTNAWSMSGITEEDMSQFPHVKKW